MTNKIVLSGIFAMLISVPFLQSSYADEYEEKLAFAGYLEETLGHFWALENNLDDNNAELALVHATHPIAELYDLMKPDLKAANPEFDEKVQTTLIDLKKTTNSDVTREDAQTAIDEAKQVIEEARLLVVGNELSQDTAFNAHLMVGLLKTSVAEYREAVSDGQINEMAEFQDGSAFVWKSQQIFNAIKGDIDDHAAEEIELFYSDLWNAYDRNADPEDVEILANGIINEIDEVTGAETEDEDLLMYVENIRALLAETKVKYAEGDKDEAMRLAIKAYLDNYEFLEPHLAESNMELMKEVELMLREDLRELIRNDAPSSEVDAQVDVILEKMDEIAKVVPEFGQIAAMILVVGTIGAVIAASKSKNTTLIPKI
jgi:predicted secreted protein with PEFG-CTERM motif